MDARDKDENLTPEQRLTKANGLNYKPRPHRLQGIVIASRGGRVDKVSVKDGAGVSFYYFDPADYPDLQLYSLVDFWGELGTSDHLNMARDLVPAKSHGRMTQILSHTRSTQVPTLDRRTPLEKLVEEVDAQVTAPSHSSFFQPGEYEQVEIQKAEQARVAQAMREEHARRVEAYRLVEAERRAEEAEARRVHNGRFWELEQGRDREQSYPDPSNFVPENVPEKRCGLCLPHKACNFMGCIDDPANWEKGLFDAVDQKVQDLNTDENLGHPTSFNWPPRDRRDR